MLELFLAVLTITYQLLFALLVSFYEISRYVINLFGVDLPTYEDATFNNKTLVAAGVGVIVLFIWKFIYA